MNRTTKRRAWLSCSMVEPGTPWQEEWFATDRLLHGYQVYRHASGAELLRVGNDVAPLCAAATLRHAAQVAHAKAMVDALVLAEAALTIRVPDCEALRAVRAVLDDVRGYREIPNHIKRALRWKR